MHSMLPFWLAAFYLPDIGPAKLLKWLAVFPSIQNFFSASKEELEKLDISAKDIQHIRSPDWAAVEKDLQWTNHDDQHIICWDDDTYPMLLKEISVPPLVLFVKGSTKILNHAQIGLVGSRHPTAYGLKNAEAFASYLSQSGFVITSGLALGIDGMAHTAALWQGTTIGVAGTGLNHVYPKKHTDLFKKIIDKDGAIISEFALRVPPIPSHFPRRNRIISGLSLGVLVVEATIKSGSLITARHALSQGREVFAIPGSIHYPQSRGCHYLIKEGAKLVETGMDIIEELGSFVSPKINTDTQTDSLTNEAKEVLEIIAYEITPMDVILLRSGLTVAELSAILLTLELEDWIQSAAGGYVRNSKNLKGGNCKNV